MVAILLQTVGTDAPLRIRNTGAVLGVLQHDTADPCGVQASAIDDPLEEPLGVVGYTPVNGPVLSEMRSTLTPTFSSSVSPRFMNGVCIS